MTSGPLEIEAKYAVGEHEPIRAKLRAAGATRVGCVIETNRFFDRADGFLQRSGCGLRVRGVSVVDGEPVSATITFKGPIRPGAMKVRPEFEVTVGDAEQAAVLMDQLGFAEFFAFEKRRETWRVRDCSVELDEVPVIGRFVEIEGPDEASVNSVAATLGFAGAAVERTSYLGLLLRGVDLSDGTRHLRLTRG